jgi:hypothetical protein
MNFNGRVFQVSCLTAFIALGQLAEPVRADDSRAGAVPFPPLVTSIAPLQAGQIPAQPQHTAAPSVQGAGAASGAGGFPAQPSSGYSFSGSALTTTGVVAVLGGLLFMLAPDGSTGNSSTSSTN